MGGVNGEAVWYDAPMPQLPQSVRPISRLGAAILATTGGASALASVAQAQPVGAAPPSPIAGAALPAASSLQSCIPYFGLDKTTSNLVQFQIQTSGPVSVTPAIGTSIIPVVTATDSGGATLQCVLDQASLAWTSESDFFGTDSPQTGYLSGTNGSFGPYTWPGANDYYETPAIGQSFTIDNTSFTPASVSISYETTIPGASITPSTSTPENIEHQYGPFNVTMPPPSDPGVLISQQRMLAVGGTQGAADMLAQLQTSAACTADPAAVASYNANVWQLDFGETNPTTYDCGANIGGAAFQSFIIYRSSLVQAKANDANLVITVSQQEPTTTVPVTVPPATLASTGAPFGLLGGVVALSTAAGLVAVRRSRRGTKA